MAGPFLYDRVKETSTTTGTGTFTLAGAATGYQSFAVVGDGNTCYYTIANQSGTEWECGIGTYTLSSTTLARTLVVASSNSNAAVSFSAGTKDVFVSAIAQILNPTFMPPTMRLTTETGVPISTSDRTAQGTLYWTPYLGSTASYWSGSGWVTKIQPQLSLSLTLTDQKVYDVFYSGTALSLSSAWTNGTTRADALGTQDGVVVLSSDHTKLHIGTIFASAANQTSDSNAFRGVWNTYNKVPRSLNVQDATASWTYNSTTFHSANNNAANAVQVVVGDLSSLVNLNVQCPTTSFDNSIIGQVGIGEDSVNTISSLQLGAYSASASTALSITTSSSIATLQKSVPLGVHFYAWLEAINTGTSAVTFYGTSSGSRNTGIAGTINN